MSTTIEDFEIKVGAKTHPQALAASIVAAYTEGKRVRIIAIGPFPVAQAFKAVCIANRTLASRGVMLCILPGLETRQIIDRATEQPVPWVISTMQLSNLLDARANGG